MQSRYESDGIFALAYLSFVCKANIDARVSTQDLDQNFLVQHSNSDFRAILVGVTTNERAT